MWPRIRTSLSTNGSGLLSMPEKRDTREKRGQARFIQVPISTPMLRSVQRRLCQANDQHRSTGFFSPSCPKTTSAITCLTSLFAIKISRHRFTAGLSIGTGVRKWRAPTFRYVAHHRQKTVWAPQSVQRISCCTRGLWHGRLAGKYRHCTRDTSRALDTDRRLGDREKPAPFS